MIRWRTSLTKTWFWVTALSVAVAVLVGPRPAKAALVKGSEPNTLAELEPIVGNIISAVVPLVGLALFAMLVYGGYQYLASGGSPEALQKAKGTLTYAVIGVALLVLAWFALLFVQTFTGVQVTRFTLPK